MEEHRIYKFEGYSLDATAKVLLKDGEPVRLARKAAEILLVLVENQGRVVTKEELFNAVWPDRVVDEANLAQNIALVRRSLGAEHGERGHIETFSGRGYRFSGPVEIVHQEPAPGPLTPEVSSEVSHTPKRRVILIAAYALIVTGVVVGAGIILYRSLRPTPSITFRIAPITRLEGREYQPAISPDGSKVAFLWQQNADKPVALWMQAVGENSPRMISAGQGECSSPAWSPDGRRLAFLRFGESTGEIVITSADGREEKVVDKVFPTRHGLPNRHLDWSPDGLWLAVDDTQSPNQPFSIFLVSVETGARKRLTQPEELIIGDVTPRFSPDGKTISFIRALHRANQELFLISAAGGTAKAVTSEGKQVTDQDWMPDGSTLIFSSNRAGEFRLWKAASALTASPGSYSPTGIYGEFPIQISVSKSTGALVYSVLQYDQNIWRFALDPISPTGNRWTRIIASSGQDASPQFSPDGRSICFRSDRTGEEELWVSGADGSNPVQITKGELRPSVGRWSPDGHSIIFNHSRSGEIFIAENTTADKWIVHPLNANGYHPVFSLDGKSIYAGTMSSIVRIPAGGGATEEIANTRGISLGISPDGDAIFFVHEATESTLWKLSLDSRELTKVLDGLVPYCTSCWAVAGEGIYYLGAKPRVWNRQAIYFREFTTGNDRVVVEYPEPLPPIGVGPFSLSPDLKSLLTVRVDSSNSDVMRVQNFR